MFLPPRRTTSYALFFARRRCFESVTAGIRGLHTYFAQSPWRTACTGVPRYGFQRYSAMLRTKATYPGLAHYG